MIFLTEEFKKLRFSSQKQLHHKAVTLNKEKVLFEINV